MRELDNQNPAASGGSIKDEKDKPPAPDDHPVLFDVGPTVPIPAVEPPPEEPKLEPPDLTTPMEFQPLSGADISANGQYRYSLWRRIAERGPTILFVGLNPSTADHEVDDPTIKAMCEFARRWGYALILVGNLFAYRAMDPKKLKEVSDPIGPENEVKLAELRSRADMCVACWGNGGSMGRRGRIAMKLLGDTSCVAVNKTGHPKHLLYVRRDTKLMSFAYAVSSL